MPYFISCLAVIASLILGKMAFDSRKELDAAAAELAQLRSEHDQTIVELRNTKRELSRFVAVPGENAPKSWFHERLSEKSSLLNQGQRYESPTPRPNTFQRR